MGPRLFDRRSYFIVAWGKRSATPGTECKSDVWPKALFTLIPTLCLGRNRCRNPSRSSTPIWFSARRIANAFLDDTIRPRVHGYLATIVRDLDSPWVVVGGVDDHAHILFDMGKMLAPVKFVEQVKRESSKFVKSLGSKYSQFYWQRGYGMFSVGPKDRDKAEWYVRNQDTHHQKVTFQQEYRALLEQYSITYDERYVWD